MKIKSGSRKISGTVTGIDPSTGRNAAFARNFAAAVMVLALWIYLLRLARITSIKVDAATGFTM